MSEVLTYPTIVLHRGCATVLEMDMTNFDYYGGYVMFTIKRKTNYDAVFEYRLDKQEKCQIVLDKIFTEKLRYASYLYDLVLVVDEEYYPLCLPSEVIVEEVVADV